MLHTVLGIACLDPYFRDAMFKTPTATIRDQGYYLRGHDVILLKAISEGKSLKSGFENVGSKICYHPPCPLVSTEVLSVIGAALLDETLRGDLFVDPLAAAKKHGFVLRYPDTYRLASLMEGKNGEHLKQAIVDLAAQLAPLMEKVELHLVA